MSRARGSARARGTGANGAGAAPASRLMLPRAEPPDTGPVLPGHRPGTPGGRASFRPAPFESLPRHRITRIPAP